MTLRGRLEERLLVLGSSVTSCPRAFVAVTTGTLAILVIATVAQPALFTQDDSIFYVVIARNIVHGDGTTFNGLMPTNGFQPLWLAILTVTVALTRAFDLTGDEAVLRAVTLVSWAMIAGTIIVLNHLLRALACRGPSRAVALAIIVAFLGGPVGTLGSEAALTALLLVASSRVAVSILQGPPRPTAASAAAFGVLLGLLVLARLDSAPVALALMAAVACAQHSPVETPSTTPQRRDNTTAGSTVSVSLAAAAIVVLPYLAWNVITFGHLAPISAALKLDLSGPWFSSEAVASGGIGLLMVGLVCGVYGTWDRRSPDAARPIWLALTGGAFTSSMIIMATGSGGTTTWYWYYVPHCVAAAVGVALAVERLCVLEHQATTTRRVSRRNAALVGAAVLLIAAAAVDLRRPSTAGARRWEEAHEFATALRRVTPTGAPVATVDLPGILALVSDHPIVALDGLTGDFAFQRDLAADGVDCVLERLGVHHLVTYEHAPWADVDVGDARALPVSAALSGQGAGTVTVMTPPLTTPSTSPLRLWRTLPTCGPSARR